MGFLIKKVQPPGPLIPPPSSPSEIPPIPDWVPPAEYAVNLKGWFREPTEFTDRHIRLIQSSLPPSTDPERIELLPALLREWARAYLPEHFAGIPLPVLARQRRRLEKVAKRATALIASLDELEGLDRWELVDRLGIVEGLGTLMADYNEYRIENKRRVDEWRSLTAAIAAAAVEQAWKPGRGQPRNILAQLVLQDLAALFEYVTGVTARRGVDRRTREESGPFLNFARAVWPVVFANGDFGLTSQLREWANHGSKTSQLLIASRDGIPNGGLCRRLSKLTVHVRDVVGRSICGTPCIAERRRWTPRP